jgi:purine-binding chemotaxis protein CheW
MSDGAEAVLDRKGAAAEGTEALGRPMDADDHGGLSSRQFVTFIVAEETFAVPLIDVQEIIRLPDMVEVPMAAASLRGLANLRGSVLPVINMRRLFALEDAACDDATRVVVINNGRPAGFIVDRMASVVTAEPGEIETMSGIRATIDSDMLNGVIKRDAGMIMMLDTAKLMACMGSTGPAGRGGQSRGSGSGASGDDHAAVGVIDEMQLVSFELDGQEYALPIEKVQEIVQVPDRITHVANTKGHVLGVMNLRDRLLPLVSLRALFGMDASAVNEQSRIVVVSHVMDGGEHCVGLVTDTVKEVLRVPRTLVDPLPHLLSAASGFREIDQICRMDGGKRLVAILLPDRLFTNAAVLEALNEATDLDQDNPMRDGTQISAMGIDDDEEQFVVFRVAEEEYAVPIDAVQEIVRVPDQLTRVPRAPAFIEGVVNLRGAVLPVVDQRRRLALPSIERNDRQRIMVFTLEGVRTGFIVDSVSEVLKISRTQISPAPQVAIHAQSAVAEVANIVGLKRMILMLDVERLLSKTETQALETLD